MTDYQSGFEVAGYRIESVIGRGGMAVVYRAEDTRLGRKVALKVLTPVLANNEQFQQRFIRESRLAASLDHPNIVPIYEAGEADGQLFIAMRYVAGADLGVVLRRDGRFDPTRALGIAAQLASALDAAHELGLIHRDVKPANVLLSDRRGVDGGEHVYLSDFGLTKRTTSKSGLTQLGQLVGTIDYIAPEQITGGTVDGRADVYALGCVFFEMLAGKPPFERESDLATMAALLHEPPPSLTALRPDLPTSADGLITRVLAKDPDQRFATATEFVREARHDLVLRPDDRAATTIPAASTVIASAPIAAQATLVNAPSPTPPPVAGPPPSIVLPPSSIAPPTSGPFAGGSEPPYVPVVSQPNAPPPKPRRYVPLALLLAAGALFILLVGGVALAIIGAPGATPTSVARVTPPATLPAATMAVASHGPTPVPVPTATLLGSTPAPTTTATVTSIPSAPPPTPTPQPTSIQPTPTSTPAGAFERLMALLDPTVVPPSQCEESTEPIFGVQPVSQAKCTTGTIDRDYVVLKNAKEVDAVWNSFDILPRNVCPGYEAGAWQYGGDAASVTRGRIACGLPGGLPQLVFSYDELNLIGVFQEQQGSTKDAITAAFTNGNGVIPQ